MTDIEEGLTPAYRAKKLLAAMDELYEGAPPEDALTDLLADARHFADAHGLAFAKQDRAAHAHYRSEIASAHGAPVEPISMVERVTEAGGKVRGRA